MSLSDLEENKPRVLIEMCLRQMIDNDVDGYCLREDGTFIKREEEGIEAIYEEF